MTCLDVIVGFCVMLVAHQCKGSCELSISYLIEDNHLDMNI